MTPGQKTDTLYVGSDEAGARYPKKSDPDLLAGPAAMKFAFIADHRADYPITTMCRVLGVSTSGFFAWQGCPVGDHQRANARLLVDILVIHAHSRKTYGSPRIHAELRAQGIVCSRGRVARLMRLNNVVAWRRKRYKVTTQVDTRSPVAPNLLARDFTADRPNVKWVADNHAHRHV